MAPGAVPATREPGQAVEAGFAQSAYAVGGTDIELASKATVGPIKPGTIRQLGFWTDDIDGAYGSLMDRGVALDRPPSEWTPLPGMRRRAFSLQGPDGLRIQIAQLL